MADVYTLDFNCCAYNPALKCSSFAGTCCAVYCANGLRAPSFRTQPHLRVDWKQGESLPSAGPGIQHLLNRAEALGLRCSNPTRAQQRRRLKALSYSHKRERLSITTICDIVRPVNLQE